ncbi:hypothetical protein E2C01_046826 [Portunus trituberculatus]|uniref:Uncharacterized protein n=1 Tax=Portunus trituberculatus TaxID=210409 RepID=A0A5B7G649_PORTR|nr:hypothetical protein [Portunus trituberculatus]
MDSTRASSTLKTRGSIQGGRDTLPRCMHLPRRIWTLPRTSSALTTRVPSREGGHAALQHLPQRNWTLP